MNWYYAEGTEQRGPVSETEFQALVSKGSITDATLVWHDGMAEWLPYGQVKAGGSAAPVPPGFQPVGGSGPMPGATGGFMADEAGRQRAMGRVNGPAIGLIATAVIGFLLNAWSAVSLVINKGKIPFEPPPGTDPEVMRQVTEMMQNIGAPVAILSLLLAIGINVLILLGGLKLRRLEGFGLVIAAAIFAMIPCTCPACCLGLPMGIWALVVMNNQDVRPHFD